MIKRFQVSSLQSAGSVLSSGFTLVELMVVLAITAIGVALATPTFEDIAERRQTTSAAEQLAAFLRTAQSEAVKRNEQIGINFTYTSATDWCVGVAEGIAFCDCKVTNAAAANYCDIGGAAHIMDNSTFNKSNMAAYSADTDENFAFDPIRGSMSVGDLADSLTERSFAFESNNGDYRLQVEITAVGRIRVCNPVSTQDVPGYPAC